MIIRSNTQTPSDVKRVVKKPALNRNSRLLLRMVFSSALVLLLLASVTATPQQRSTKRRQPGKSTTSKPTERKSPVIESAPPSSNDSQATAAPTLKETLEWISSTLKAPPLFGAAHDMKPMEGESVFTTDDKFEHKITDVRNDRCTLSIDFTQYANETNRTTNKERKTVYLLERTLRHTGSLELDLATSTGVAMNEVTMDDASLSAFYGHFIVHKIDKNIYELRVYAKTRFKMLEERTTQTYIPSLGSDPSELLRGSDSIDVFKNIASLYVNDKDIAERLKKAFEHAGKLCHKKEPF